MQLDNIIEVIRNAAFIGGQLIHIFCFSLQGQKLIDHSLEMQDKMWDNNCKIVTYMFTINLHSKEMDYILKFVLLYRYNCSWYKIPVKSQRLLLNAMKRSLQPNVLSAGGIYIFSLKSFTTVKRICFHEYNLHVLYMFLWSSKTLALTLKVLQSSISYFTVLASFQ